MTNTNLIQNTLSKEEIIKISSDALNQAQKIKTYVPCLNKVNLKIHKVYGNFRITSELEIVTRDKNCYKSSYVVLVNYYTFSEIELTEGIGKVIRLAIIGAKEKGFDFTFFTSNDINVFHEYLLEDDN